MTRVLALHFDKTLALPPDENHRQSIQRHLGYAQKLDDYCIITKTLASEPRPAYSPAANMDVIPTNSANRYTFLAQAYRLASRAIAERNVDVITLQDWRWLGVLGLLLRQQHGVALNLQLHNRIFDNPYYRREDAKSWMGDRLAHYVVPRGDTFWVGTQTQKQRLIARGFPAERIFAVPYSIDGGMVARADGSQLRQQYEREGFTHILLWTGRIVPQKDLETAIASLPSILAAHPQTLLSIVGEGARRPALEALVAQMGLEKHVRFHGYIPYLDLGSHYQAADVICISSLYEGTCRTLHEGMAAGKPVVATEVDGALDALRDGISGYIVPRRSPEQMAAAVVKLLGDRELARRMGDRAREDLQRDMTMERHYEGFLAAWDATARLTANKQLNHSQFAIRN